MSNDPVTGPVPPQVFKALADAPHGHAARTIREYDPTWGLDGQPEPETKTWLVFLRVRMVDAEGTIMIKAPTKTLAEQLAKAQIESPDEFKKIDWEVRSRDVDPCDVCIDSVTDYGR